MAWGDAIDTVRGSTRSRVGPLTVARLLTDPVTRNQWTGIATSPVDLHKAAGLDRNVYAVARCIKSEVGDENVYSVLAIAETLHNAARRKGIEPYLWLVNLTTASRAWTRFKYGEQSGRRASTRQDPTHRTVAAAKLAASTSLDFVGGAVTWFDPRTQDSGRQGRNDLRFDAVGIANKWAADGYQWVGPMPGIDSYREAAFLKPVAKADPTALIRVIELGRKGAPLVGPSSPDERTAAVAELGSPWWAIAAAATLVLV